MSDLKPMSKTDHPPAAEAGQKTEPDQQLTAQHGVQRTLSPAADRALAEAAARRAEIDRRTAAMAPEDNGRKGPEPVRYGDWEVKGLATDF